MKNWKRISYLFALVGFTLATTMSARDLSQPGSVLIVARIIKDVRPICVTDGVDQQIQRTRNE